MRRDTRSGFRTFCRDLIGSQPLAMAMLRHGFQTPGSIAALAVEIWKAQKSVPEANTWQSHPELAEAAYSARREYKWGKHMSQRLKDFGPEGFSKQDQLYASKYDSGFLYSQMMKANQAWGHGQGAEGNISLEKVAVLELETRSLTQYWQEE